MAEVTYFATDDGIAAGGRQVSSILHRAFLSGALRVFEQCVAILP